MAVTSLLLWISPTRIFLMTHPNQKHSKKRGGGNTGKCSSVSQVDRLQNNQSRSRKTEAEVLFIQCLLISMVLSISRLIFHLSLYFSTAQEADHYQLHHTDSLVFWLLFGGLAKRGCWHEEWADNVKGWSRYFTLSSCLVVIPAGTEFHNGHYCTPEAPLSHLPFFPSF